VKEHPAFLAKLPGSSSQRSRLFPYSLKVKYFGSETVLYVLHTNFPLRSQQLLDFPENS
jgi:hypothetical protein